MIPPHADKPEDPSGPPEGAQGRPPAAAWYEDAAEVDRYLDGEGDAAERARREADLAARPKARAVVAGRGAFLEALRSARWAPGGVSAERLRTLEQRVRAALRQDRETAEFPHERAPVLGSAGRRFGRARPFVVGAAALLAGVGAWLLHGNDQTADALDPYVAMAADVLDWKPQAFETCAQGGASDVHSFALVIGGELQVTGCASDPAAKGASVAVLRRPEELPIVGYVAVPASGTAEAGVVGITEVEGGRVAVFDVLDHGRRVYLAVNPASLRAKYPEPGHRWSCAACHGPARQGMANPHRIVLRRAP